MTLRSALAAILPTRSTQSRDPLGPRGERIAARYLKRHHYRIIDRNLIIAGGELDLVCLHPDKRTIVIVEVKARRLRTGAEHTAPPPEAQLHVHKRRQLLRLTKSLIRARGWIDRPIRIDLIAVEAPERGRAVVRHHQSAVSENDS